MKGIRLGDVIEAVDGEVVAGTAPDATINTTVTHDSRTVSRGDIFVAIAGDSHDGHDFVDAAIQAGAAAALVARSHPIVSMSPSSTGCIVAVDDPLAALGRLARWWLRQHPQVNVVALTGSSGKTSTKDLIAQVLAADGPVVCPPGSFNNEVGMPMTILQVDDTTRHLVLEMGARGRGHIRYLCDIASPHVGVVLNVGRAHVGEFGSLDDTADAKGELVEALSDTGVAILNCDDPRVWQMRNRTSARVIGFGARADADLRIDNSVLDDDARPQFDLVFPPTVGAPPVDHPEEPGDRATVTVGLNLHGAHHASNAAAAAAVGVAAGMSPQLIARQLSTAESQSRWRMEVKTGRSGITVINDSYNANPESMAAALRALAALTRPRRAAGARAWAVLGEMRELGSDSQVHHDEIGRLAVRLGVDRLVGIGELARPMVLGAAQEGYYGGEGRWVSSVEEAESLLAQELQPTDVVLVKASRALGLEHVAEFLLTDGHDEERSE